MTKCISGPAETGPLTPVPGVYCTDGHIVPQVAKREQLTFRTPPGRKRAMGVEPTQTAWKAVVLPLHHARKGWMDGEGFEPPKANASRFTVCPLWPLGNPSWDKCLSRQEESNPRPEVYKTPALPAELCRLVLSDRAAGLSNTVLDCRAQLYPENPTRQGATAGVDETALPRAGAIGWLSAALGEPCSEQLLAAESLSTHGILHNPGLGREVHEVKARPDLPAEALAAADWPLWTRSLRPRLRSSNRARRLAMGRQCPSSCQPSSPSLVVLTTRRQASVCAEPA
jgi:hypothetical protein